MNTQYERVIPRDLFNEAKLLKCVGLLVLKIHDGENPANVYHALLGYFFSHIQ